MIKKYISHSGVTIETGDFYGGAVDSEGMGEVVSSLEELGNQLQVNTNLGFYQIDLKPGDYLGMHDGSGKVVKNKHDDIETSF